jgi:DNA replication protein DnaC
MIGALTPAEMGIPEHYWKADLNSESQACRILKAFRQAEKGDVFRLLLGIYGCGKTYACHAYQIALGGHAVYYEGKRLRDLAVGEMREELLRTTTEMPYVLIIDDLGSEHESESGYFESVVRQIINRRYSMLMRTVITSNFNLEEFQEQYGQGVVDRIREKGKIVELERIDYRKSQRPENVKAGERGAVRRS